MEELNSPIRPVSGSLTSHVAAGDAWHRPYRMRCHDRFALAVADHRHDRADDEREDRQDGKHDAAREQPDRERDDEAEQRGCHHHWCAGADRSCRADAGDDSRSVDALNHRPEHVNRADGEEDASDCHLRDVVQRLGEEVVGADPETEQQQDEEQQDRALEEADHESADPARADGDRSGNAVGTDADTSLPEEERLQRGENGCPADVGDEQGLEEIAERVLGFGGHKSMALFRFAIVGELGLVCTSPVRNDFRLRLEFTSSPARRSCPASRSGTNRRRRCRAC